MEAFSYTTKLILYFGVAALDGEALVKLDMQFCFSANLLLLMLVGGGGASRLCQLRQLTLTLLQGCRVFSVKV